MRTKDFILKIYPLYFLLKTIKNFIIYQYFRLKNTNNSYKLSEKLKIIKIPRFKNTFFGYYDITPFNPENPSLVLFHANNLRSNRKPNINIGTNIGIFNLDTFDYKLIDQTHSWNWQQGSRLQWLNSNLIIYNYYNFKRERLNARIYDNITNEIIDLPIPVNASYLDKYIISLDYYLLTKFSEYGYNGLSQKSSSKLVEFLDLKKMEVLTLFSLDDVEILFTNNLKREKSHINHILINKSGTKFIFIYRYFIRGNRLDSLILYSLINRNFELLISNQCISHYTWKSENEILFWGIIDNQHGYFIFNIQSKEIKLIYNDLNDGHPSFLNETIIITDCYPNIKTQTHSLIRIDFINKKKEELIKLKHPFTYFNDNRCDLHPSFSHDKKYFQIDTRHYNDRNMIIGELY